MVSKQPNSRNRFYLKFLCLLITALMFTTRNMDAQHFPGGVGKVSKWYLASKDSVDNTFFCNQLNDSILSVSKSSTSKINGNVAFLFSEKSKGIEQVFDNKLFSGLSFFSVALPVDTTHEQSIWSIENDSAVTMILTTRRMADIATIGYMNFEENTKASPQIYTYIQRKNNDSTTVKNYRLRMGMKPAATNLPVGAFNGLVPEILLFDRALKLSERQTVESYLAIKYGITIKQTMPTPYLAGNGSEVWNPTLNSSYANRIFGLAVDSTTTLQQLESGSSEMPDLIRFEAQQQSAVYNSDQVWYWLGGDNGSSLKLVSQDFRPRQLARQWRFQYTGEKASSKCDVTFNTKFLEIMDALPASESLWLAIDQAADGKFAVGKTRFVKGIKSNESYRFKDMACDADSSGTDNIGIVAAPDFFIWGECVHSNCSNNTNGLINFDLVGGNSPYCVKLMDDAGTVLQNIIDQKTNYTFDNLMPGDYTLVVSDSKGRADKQQVTLRNSDLISNALCANYILPKGETLNVDASIGMKTGLSYQWTMNGVDAHESVFQTSTPGECVLKVSNAEGCSSSVKINITSTESTQISAFKLFPNPSTNGHFEVKVQLLQSMPIEISMFDTSGRKLSTAKFNGSDFYRIPGYVPTPGSYVVQIKTATEQKSVVLLVK